jgi:predicted outer membrane lipoprotein
LSWTVGETHIGSAAVCHHNRKSGIFFSAGDAIVKIKSQKDFFSGLMFMVVGIAFAIGATTYNIGEGARMGPGYFPLMLGILLAAIGAFTIFEALVVETEDGEPVGSIAWKPLFFIIGSNVLFGVLLAGLPGIGLPAMGLIVAIYGLTFVASLAGDEFKFKEVLVVATILAVGSYVAFIWMLKLQFPVWPSFITG